MSNEKTTLPQLADLTKDKLTAAQTDQFNYLLNRRPPEKWIKQNSYAGGALYLPIDKVELLLKRLFKQYRIEIIEVKMLLNSVTATARVHYRHPVTGEWQYHDGVGAKEVQTQKSTGALKADMSNVSRGAMEKCVPIAKTNAVKNACKNFGKLFGSDLNREDTLAFSTDENLQKRPVSDEDFPQLVEAIENGDIPVGTAISRYDLTNDQKDKIWEVSKDA